LVRWKGFTAESNTWKERENLKNVKEVIKEFKKEYRQDMKDVVKQKYEEGTFRRGELPGRFTARKLFEWSDKIQPRILGKARKELEMVERKAIRGKKNRNNCRGRRNQGRKFRS